MSYFSKVFHVVPIFLFLDREKSNVFSDRTFLFEICIVKRPLPRVFQVITYQLCEAQCCETITYIHCAQAKIALLFQLIGNKKLQRWVFCKMISTNFASVISILCTSQKMGPKRLALDGAKTTAKSAIPRRKRILSSKFCL